jgi:U3 small nucleolar ribonucleoprotein protein IMP4
MTFANYRDSIHFRHYNYEKNEKKLAKMSVGDADAQLQAKDVELAEVGPRFTLNLYKVDLGTVDMKEVKTEWVLRPYFNKQKDVLANK